MVLNHADVHDVHYIGVIIKLKVSPKVRVADHVASHAHNLFDYIGANDREVAHKLRYEDGRILMCVAWSVTKGISDKSRKVNHFHVVTIPHNHTKVKRFLSFFFFFIVIFFHFLLDKVFCKNLRNLLSINELQRGAGRAALSR